MKYYNMIKKLNSREANIVREVYESSSIDRYVYRSKDTFFVMTDYEIKLLFNKADILQWPVFRIDELRYHSDGSVTVR